MVYAIATRFSEQARQRAASEAYQQGIGSRFTHDLRCPLGACLYHDHVDVDAKAPSSTHVADLLTRSVLGRWPTDLFVDLEIEAREFIRDWDRGIITDLAAALGVNEPAPPAGEEAGVAEDGRRDE